MNRCEELKQLIDEGYNLKASAYLAWFPNNFGQLMQLPAINESELIKWNTKIDLFFQKTNSPIRNLKRNEFPNHTIVQYMEIKLKTMEGLLETWKNEDTTKIEPSSEIVNRPKKTRKKGKAKQKNSKTSTKSNLNININTTTQKNFKEKSEGYAILKIIVEIIVALIGSCTISYLVYTHIENKNFTQQQNNLQNEQKQNNSQQTVVNINLVNHEENK